MSDPLPPPQLSPDEGGETVADNSHPATRRKGKLAFFLSALSLAYTALELWYRGLNSYAILGLAISFACVAVFVVRYGSETTWSGANILVALASVTIAVFAA